MKKIIISSMIFFYGVMGSSAQELLPAFADKLNEIVTERVKVMELSEKQEKSFTDIQKKRLFEIQKLGDKYSPGTESYKAKVMLLNKKYNKFILKLVTNEQRIKWVEYMKTKRENQ